MQVTVRAFEKILSDKGLAECVGNVVKNIDSLSVSLSERVPSLDFVNHCILEYKRLETKDDVAARRKELMLKEKQARKQVKDLDQLFYKDPRILMRNYKEDEQHDRVTDAKHRANEDLEQEQVTASFSQDALQQFLSMGTVKSQFRNEPPTSREEMLRSRKFENTKKEEGNITNVSQLLKGGKAAEG